MTTPKRPTLARLLVSPSTATRVDRARIDLIVRTGKESTKTQIHDAMLAVAIDHIDEVAARLTAGGAAG